MKIAPNILKFIGNTPMLQLSIFAPDMNIAAKIEYFNPAGSVKDRAALGMIEDAEARGALKPGSTIIEPTSGNTGIGLAMVSAIKGYKVILTMPETMSAERRALLKAYGAQLVLTPGNLGMSGAIAKAKELLAETPDSFMPAQFDNPANAQAHFHTTGPEIWRDTDGKVDVLVCGVGSGGTITGTGRFLKSKNSNIKVIAVEPASSPVLSGGMPGAHKIQGIGAGFVPSLLDKSVIDEIITVTNEDAYAAANELIKKEGLLCGISSGAAAWAAREAARKYPDKTIVVLLPDTGERYLSAGVF